MLTSASLIFSADVIVQGRLSTSAQHPQTEVPPHLCQPLHLLRCCHGDGLLHQHVHARTRKVQLKPLLKIVDAPCMSIRT